MIKQLTTHLSSLCILGLALSHPITAKAAANADVEPEKESTSASSSGINLKISGGSARFRAEGNDYTDLKGDRDFLSIRVRPDFLLTVDPTLSVLFEPQAAKVFGQEVYTTDQTSATLSQTSGNKADSSVGVHQAYIDWHPAEMFELLAGRQILSYGDELVLGASDWGVVGRSFDAVRLRTKYALGTSDLIYSKLVEDNVTSPQTGGDSNLYGLYNSWNLGHSLHAVDLYWLYQINDTTVNAASPLRTQAIGVRLKSTLRDFDYLGERFNQFVTPFDYRVEATREFGSGVADGDGAYQVDGEVGYTLVGLAFKPRLGLEYSIAGPNYNQLYPSPHKWLGFADVFGRQNITDWAVHLSADIMAKFGAQLDFHDFLRTSALYPAYNTSTPPSAIGKTAPVTSKSLATEWDLTLRYRVTSRTSIATGGSLVQAGDYFQSEFGNRNPRFYYALIETAF